MNYTRVKRIICLLVTLVGILFSVSPVAASTLEIPDELIHEGLTFSSALHYTSDTDIVEVKHISFMTDSSEMTTEEEVIYEPQEAGPELYVKDTTKEIVFAEEIVLPTPKKEILTPTPTIMKKTTPTPTIQVLAATKTPESTATPTNTPIPATPTSSSLPSYATNGTLNADTMFSMVNQKRADAGLPAFEKHPDVCAVAEARKSEIENEVYGSSSIHAGFRARELPFRASENMISQNSEEAALNWWMNSSIHRAGILGGSKYACIACQNKTCAMIMSSLEPK